MVAVCSLVVQCEELPMPEVPEVVPASMCWCPCTIDYDPVRWL